MYLTGLDLYRAELSRFSRLTPEQEIEVAHRARAGDESALNELVVANLRFVVMIAKRFRDRGVPFPDLVQEGNMGLMLAARKFDPERGVRFISYAVWWVRQRMLTALERQRRAIRIPPSWVSDLRAVLRERERLMQTLGRAPTLAELAIATELSPERIDQVLVFELSEASLDAPVNEDWGDATLAEKVAIESGNVTDAGALYNGLAEHVDRALDTVNPREASVVRLYYGLGGRREHTYEEVGTLLGVSGGRAMQIHDRAILRLRDSEQCEALASLLDGGAPVDWDFDPL